jgi:hypothetical protein
VACQQHQQLSQLHGWERGLVACWMLCMMICVQLWQQVEVASCQQAELQE